MNLEHLRGELQSIAKNLQSSDFETEWLNTVSGHIYSRLQTISKQLNLPLSVENKGGTRELFKIGEQTARLYKRLMDSSVGEDGGTIDTFAEGWEYKRYIWWKMALDQEGMPVILLDTPVANLAQDAGVSNWENYFIPSKVVAQYTLVKDNNPDQLLVEKEWVKQIITDTLDPLLKPDFDVRYRQDCLRLYPLTEESRKSRTEDNVPYERAKTNILSVVKKLDDIYRGRKTKRTEHL
jgi:hypothetical protein